MYIKLIRFSRTLAEQSPYYDTMKTNGVEVLFCYESYDELVLMHLKEYKSYALTSVEKEMRKKSDSKDCGELCLYCSSF